MMHLCVLSNSSVIERGYYDTGHVILKERFPRRSHKSGKKGKRGKGEWEAPEVRMNGLRTVKSDIYSLGWMLYELLTGKPPRRDSQGLWISPAEEVPESEGLLANTIVGALEVDPMRRHDARSLDRGFRYAAGFAGITGRMVM